MHSDRIVWNSVEKAAIQGRFGEVFADELEPVLLQISASELKKAPFTPDGGETYFLMMEGGLFMIPKYEMAVKLEPLEDTGLYTTELDPQKPFNPYLKVVRIQAEGRKFHA